VRGGIARACYGVPGECRLILECDKILFCRETIFGLNSEEISSVIIASRWWPGWSKRSNSAGFVRWILFFWTADRPQDMRSKKHYISSAFWFFAFHSQTSNIFIGFLTSFSTVRRQVELSYRSNFANSCFPSGINDRNVLHITYINPWRITSHSSTCRQIMRWSGCQMEMRSPIGRSTWFGVRNWC
jgi:hypothetical protein